MTSKDSTIRLALYVAISAITSTLTGLERMQTADWKEIVTIGLQTLLAAMVTARAYIDQTPNQVKP